MQQKIRLTVAIGADDGDIAVSDVQGDGLDDDAVIRQCERYAMPRFIAEHPQIPHGHMFGERCRKERLLERASMEACGGVDGIDQCLNMTYRTATEPHDSLAVMAVGASRHGGTDVCGGIGADQFVGLHPIGDS